MENVVEIITDEINRFLNEEDYRMWHKAPGSNDAPLHDMTVLFPDDIYAADAARRYKHLGGNIDAQAITIIQAARNQPDKPIETYRAVPLTDKGLEINNGDWVTISPEYAKRHAESNIDGQYTILTKTVPARNLYNEGNSILEWGYFVN